MCQISIPWRPQMPLTWATNVCHMCAGRALEPVMFELPGRWLRLYRDLLWAQSYAHPTLSHVTGTRTLPLAILSECQACRCLHTSQTQRESQLCSHRKRSARHTLIISQVTVVPFALIMVPFTFMMRKDCRLVILLWNKNYPILLCQVSGSVSLHRKQLNNCKLSC